MFSPSRVLAALLAGSDEAARVASASVSAVGVAVTSLAQGVRADVPPRARMAKAHLPEPQSEQGGLSAAGPWTADRLRRVLHDSLKGERVIVVANRAPRIHEFAADGDIVVRHPASGLVTALEPVMRACSGVWVAHGNGTADRVSSDRQGRCVVRAADSEYRLRRVWLSGCRHDSPLAVSNAPRGLCKG